VRRVLDQAKPVSAGELEQRVLVARLPREVHREDRAGARAEHLGDACRVEVQRGGIDVGEDRDRSRVEQHVRGRDPGHGRGHDLVARPDAAGQHGEVEGGRAGARPERVADAQALGEELLEPPGPGPGREPPRAKAGLHLGDLVVGDRRAGVGQHPRKSVPEVRPRPQKPRIS